MNIFSDRRPLMGQDPFVARFKDQYLLAESIDEAKISITEISSLGRPKRQTQFIVWDRPEEFQVWAPELHQIDGFWYVYYSAATAYGNHTHRNYVLGAGSTPLGPFHFKEQIGPDVWGIDMTTFTWNGSRYAVWSGWENNGDGFPQHLYIAAMESPVAIGERIKLASPYLEWEKSVAPILEGPQAFTHQNDLYLLYSANASWTQDYATGVLRLDGNDPLNPEHWKRAWHPVMSNAGHGHVVDDHFIYHRKMSAFPGWNDREILTMPLSEVF